MATVTTHVRSEAETKQRAGSAFALPPERFVVSHGVRHVVIDVLLWNVVTFRTVCGQDIVEDEHPPADLTECKWCGHFERTWLLVKSTDAI